jgi:hypothetical protein
MALELNTYGDLKKAIKAIALKQKGQAIVSQGKSFVLDQLLGLIPGASNAKTTFEFIRAAISKPDTKKTNTWLDKLDIDDAMSAIVDDTVENGFMQMMSKTIESKPDNQPLEQDFNMNAEMVDYLKNTYRGRTVSGISEEKKAALKSAVKAYAREIMMSEENVTGSGATFNAGYGENYATPYAFGKKKGDNRAVKFLKKMGWTVADLTLPKNSKMFDYKKIYEMKLNDMIEQGVLNEVSYGKFKKEVTYRTKSEQLHKAIREVKRKLQEIDRIVEYTSRMKQELSEGEDGIRYWKATQKNVANISEMVNQLNNKIKNLNQ